MRTIIIILLFSNICFSQKTDNWYLLKNPFEKMKFSINFPKEPKFGIDNGVVYVWEVYEYDDDYQNDSILYRLSISDFSQLDITFDDYKKEQKFMFELLSKKNKGTFIEENTGEYQGLPMYELVYKINDHFLIGRLIWKNKIVYSLDIYCPSRTTSHIDKFIHSLNIKE